MALRIEAIPAFTDNYIWALIDQGRCVLVDPGDANPARDFLRANDLELIGLLLTHHHPDHVGGVNALRAAKPVPAWGPADARMPDDIEIVGEGDQVWVAEFGLRFKVLETPGHTLSHIAFHGLDLLFCGDTLFSSGCGRLFEGTPTQMQASLDKLADLPDATRVFCAHEYTRANCRFALRVEPNNRALRKRADEVEKLRAKDLITLPTTLGDEKRFNPFLRTRQPEVIAAAQARQPDTSAAPEAVFGVIRRWKDAF